MENIKVEGSKMMLAQPSENAVGNMVRRGKLKYPSSKVDFKK